MALLTAWPRSLWKWASSGREYAAAGRGSGGTTSQPMVLPSVSARAMPVHAAGDARKR